MGDTKAGILIGIITGTRTRLFHIIYIETIDFGKYLSYGIRP